MRTTWSREGRRSHGTTFVVAVLATLATLAALVALPVPGWAHGRLKRAIPAAGSHASAAPRELRLEFTEEPALAVSALRLLDSTGRELPLGAIAHAADSRRALVAPVLSVLAAGTYTVAWQMAGDDGHPVRGRYSFTVDPVAEAQAAGPAVATPVVPPVPPRRAGTDAPTEDDFGIGSPAYVAIRWLQYLGLLLVIGAVTLRQIARRVSRRRALEEAPLWRAILRGAARAGALASGLLAATALARLYAQSRAMHGGAAALDAALLAPMLGRTLWGAGWLLQLVLSLVAAVAFGFALRAPESTPIWRLATRAVAGLAFVPALSGHAASVPQLWSVAVLSDALHVLAAGSWLGGLALIALVALPETMRTPVAPRAEVVAALVRAFSPVALGCVVVLAVTGALAGWLHLGGLPELWASRYGRTLLVKLALVLIVALVGGYNWRRATPALGADAGVDRLERSARVELLFGALVLFVTAVLVATPPAVETLGGSGM